MNIAISGFGRIGRTLLRVLLQDPEARKKLTVTTINVGPHRPDTLDILFKYDTVMGIYSGEVRYDGARLIVNGHEIEIIAQAHPKECKWRERNVHTVIDSSGKFSDRSGAQQHLDGGAQQVVVTAPAQHIPTVIPGVNDGNFAFDMVMLSVGSCTTNALAPMVKLVHDFCAIEQAAMTTVHAYTSTQALLDNDMGDPRRSRGAALNIVPTTTGAMEVIEEVVPAIKGRIIGSSLRVPVPKVSLIDLTCVVKKPCSAEQLNAACATAAAGAMRGIMRVEKTPLVSSDFSGTTESVIIDGQLTDAHENIVKLFGWYDNEWAYCERVKDVLLRAERS